MTKKYLILFLMVNLSLSLSAQKYLPAVEIESLKGDKIKASGLSNNENPIIISFWATWCKPCISELEAINDEYEKWQEETGIKLIAISIDDERSTSKVKTMVYGKDWPFEIYLDKNQNLKRALHIINIPHTFLLNGKGEIVWQKNSYLPGSEQELFEEIKKLTEVQKK
ncbi:MAG: TlpA disulfide reductase family protein [Bacteroidota bacterium]